MSSLLAFLIVLSLVVLIHELGHFLSAKKVGVKVEEFGFGIPPRLWGKKIGETIYSINWLPFGGFVKLFGQQREGATKKELGSPRAFVNQGKKKRALVIVAGIIGNFLLGAVCFSIVYSFIGIPKKVNYVVVDYVISDSPAEKAGIKENDKIVGVLDKKIVSVDQFVKLIDERGEIETEIEIVSKIKGKFDESSRRTVVVVPRKDPPEGEGALGILISGYDNIFYPLWQMPFRGAWIGGQEAIGWGAAMVLGLAQMIKELFIGVVPEVSGPVGIYKITSGVVSQGALALIKFTGILSINLAVVNLLPFPALDGGWLALVFLEKARGRKLRAKVEYWLNAVGMVILISLMLAITAKEIIKELENVAWWGRLKNM